MRHLTPDLFDFVTGWLPPAPARLLDVGCGNGALTHRLRTSGYQVTGLDPDAPAGEEFVRSTLEEFHPTARFDSAVAIRSLHHLGDLEQALAHLRAALRPKGRLVLFEFRMESIDTAAQGWLERHRLEREISWDLSDVIPLADLRQALSRHFRLLFEEPTAYLARELDREDMQEQEEKAIARGELQPAGMRLVYALIASTGPEQAMRATESAQPGTPSGRA